MAPIISMSQKIIEVINYFKISKYLKKNKQQKPKKNKKTTKKNTKKLKLKTYRSTGQRNESTWDAQLTVCLAVNN